MIHSELLGSHTLKQLLSEEATEARKLYEKAREEDPNRNVIWISKEDLKDLLWKKPMLEIAKDYGVSDKSISFWIKSYGLTKPPRGHWAKKSSRERQCQ